MIRSFMEGYAQFIKLPIVDLGTPLFRESWYGVMPRSFNNSTSRLLTAWFNCNAIRFPTSPL